MQVVDIELSKLKEPESAARIQPDDESIIELAQSIGKIGLISAITVKEAGKGKYEIVAGHRRFLAHKLLGRKTIPSHVVDSDEQSSEIIKITENIERKQLTTFEEIIAIVNYIDKFKLSIRDGAKLFNKSKTAIQDYMALANADPEIQKNLHAGKIGLRVSLELCRIKDIPMMGELLSKTITYSYTIATVRNMVNYALQTIEAQGQEEGTKETRPSNLPKMETLIECQMCANPVLIQDVQSFTVCPNCGDIIEQYKREAKKEKTTKKQQAHTHENTEQLNIAEQ